MSQHYAEPAGEAPPWTIVDRLRKAREAANLTQEELADRSGISLRTVSNYEKADYAAIRKRSFLITWALACGVSFSWLTDGDGGRDLPMDSGRCTSVLAGQGSFDFAEPVPEPALSDAA